MKIQSRRESWYLRCMLCQRTALFLVCEWSFNKTVKKKMILQAFSRREPSCFYWVFQVLHNLPPNFLSMLKFHYITPLGESSTWAEWMCSLPLDSPIIFCILTFGHVCFLMGNLFLPHDLPHFYPFSSNHFKIPLFPGSF